MYATEHQNLYTWYETHGRHDLPWRRTDDAYKIWVSEIMLQQTQVKTVLERFYFPFLEAFPTLEDLAAADLDEVLKKWEGLGYYTRAQNLYRAARLSSPKLPESVSELKELPGIGNSTAHAIAAFAYHTPLPILDANVKRILYRFFGIKKATEKELWNLAYTLFDVVHPYHYNQAMMDLGSMVCTAKNPQCAECPFSTACKGITAPLDYPDKRAPKKVPVRRKIILVYHHDVRYGLYQRRTRFLHGLWGFPEYDAMNTSGMKHLGNMTQKYSHFTLHGEVYLCESRPDDLHWFTRDEMNALALGKADHKILRMLVL